MDYHGRYKILNPSRIRRYPLNQRRNKVRLEQLADPNVVCRRPIELSGPIEQTIDTLARSIRSARSAGKAVTIRQLELAIVNLAVNARDAMPDGGRLTISSSACAPGSVSFSVSDTGTGIPADELERVFERFYKADRARSGGGTGLGLSIARHIIEAHGGRIWVESIEGQGSTFFFTIPLS